MKPKLVALALTFVLCCHLFGGHLFHRHAKACGGVVAQPAFVSSAVGYSACPQVVAYAQPAVVAYAQPLVVATPFVQVNNVVRTPRFQRTVVRTRTVVR